MKLSQGDLDQEAVSKLTRLDGIVDGFEPDDINGFVGYDGKKFYVRKTNDVFLRKIFSESEISDLEADMRKKGAHNAFYSSGDGVYEEDNKASLEFPTLSVTAKAGIEYSAAKGDHIRMVCGKSALTEKGTIIADFSADPEEIESIDILSEIKSNFAVENFGPFDILSFIPYGSGYLVSTTICGIVFYDSKAKTIEIRMAENGVTSMMVMKNSEILCCIGKNTANVCVYDFASGKKVDSFNQLKKSGNQQGRFIMTDGDRDYFVIGETYGVNQSDRLLHYFRLDANYAALRCHDGDVHPCGLPYDRKILSSCIYGGKAYISGIANGQIFVLEYSRLFIGDEPVVRYLSNIDPANVADIVVAGSPSGDRKDQSAYFYILLKNRILVFGSDGSIAENIYLVGSSDIDPKGISVADGKARIWGRNGISILDLPRYSSYQSLSLVAYDSDKPCNNIDIAILAESAPSVAIIDAETLATIKPAFSILEGGMYVAKLLGCKSRKIIAKVGTEKNRILGMAVKADRIYLR
jgi:hypothetical protein